MPKLRLFTIHGRLLTIKDALKLDITDILNEGNKSFKDMQSRTSKPKSSLSVKLDEMKKEGLISSFPDPLDKRSKLYQLDARLVGTSHNAAPELFETTMLRMDKVMDDPFEFMNYLFRSMWHLLDSFGIDAHPMLNILGENVGKQLSSKIKSGDARGIMEEVSLFFKKNKFAFVKIEEGIPLTFSLFDCCQCGSIKGKGGCLCSFYKGILNNIFLDKLGSNIVLREIECHSKGHEACKFILLE